MAKIINGSSLYLALANYLASNAYLNDTAQDVLEMVCVWIDEAKAIQVPKWIPVTERLPEPETDVLVLAERKVFSYEKKCMITKRIVTTAMYEDGCQNNEDSIWWWWETDGFAYDEDLGAYIIPEGWLERKYYVMEEDLNHFMDDVVTHWMPLPEPPKEVE